MYRVSLLTSDMVHPADCMMLVNLESTRLHRTLEYALLKIVILSLHHERFQYHQAAQPATTMTMMRHAHPHPLELSLSSFLGGGGGSR